MTKRGDEGNELLVPMVFGWGVILYYIIISYTTVALDLDLGELNVLKLPLGCLVGM